MLPTLMGTRGFRKWCIAHYELVNCLRFVIVVRSVPAGDAAPKVVALCRLTPFALSTVTSRYMCISIGMGGQSAGKFVENKIKKDLTIKMKWDIKG